MAYIPTLPHMKALDITMSAYKDSALSKPHVSVNLNQLITSLKKGYSLTSGGKFVEVLPIMRGILHSIPLLSVRSEQEENEAKELVEKKCCTKQLLRVQMYLTTGVMEMVR